jgi:HPt (histidine-containing phosphotransfer) domain-containing protein
MDGIEATRRIRAFGGEYETLPLVALSANAVSSAVEAYFAAGMNGFVSKPIEAEKLNAALARWLPSEKTTIIQEAEQGQETPAQENLMKELKSVMCIDTAKGLVYSGGDKEMYIQVLRQFCDEIPDTVGIIKSLMAARNWEEYSIRMHGMKSVLANVGAEARAEMAYKLEMASKSRDEITCLTETGPLCNSILALRDHLLCTSLMEEVKQEKKIAMSGDVLRGKLERLKESCMGGKIEETNAAVSELRLATLDEKADERLERILHSLKSYDYEAAMEQIDNLTVYLQGKRE